MSDEAMEACREVLAAQACGELSYRTSSGRGYEAMLAVENAVKSAPDPASDLARLRAELADMEKRKDAAYEERNRVVAALAKCLPSGVAKTAIEGWSEDWHGCVYIDLLNGQASWHFHDSHAHLFAGLPAYADAWDGHTTEEKYRRLDALEPVAADIQWDRMVGGIIDAYTLSPNDEDEKRDRVRATLQYELRPILRRRVDKDADRLRAENGRMREACETLAEAWNARATESHEESGRIRRTIKQPTGAEERCLVRAECWDKCAEQLRAALAAPAGEAGGTAGSDTTGKDQSCR